MSPRTANSIAEVVSSGLCIGCGLCEAVTHGRVRMQMTDYGALRPSPVEDFSEVEQAQLLAACPGVTVRSRFAQDGDTDPVWGHYQSMHYAWAGDPDIRFRGATGGVLTALAAHLLTTAKVAFVLHVMPDRDQPMRSCWTISETVEAVLAGMGSRYGPVAPLAGFVRALERDQPFAIVAKPCDLNAVHNFSHTDPRVDALCVIRLAMVCGGQSRLKKSQDLLEQLGLREQQVSLFRHRGYGNPGPTRVETHDGRSFEKSYLELWQDEAGWQLETRCKFCPDALGEAADIAVTDVWPGGSPSGEDAGFNGLITRSSVGSALMESAVKKGNLVLGSSITPRQLDDFQPHQLRKKRALKARFLGLSQAGLPIIETPGLRLAELDAGIHPATREAELAGTTRRAQQGRFSETVQPVSKIRDEL